MPVECRVGALEFRLARVEHRPMPELSAIPFMLLPDGTEVGRTNLGAETYLVIDHRSNPQLSARIEFWDVSCASEYPVSGLLTLCEALTQRS